MKMRLSYDTVLNQLAIGFNAIYGEPVKFDKLKILEAFSSLFKVLEFYLMIAAIVKTNNLILVTIDKKDFEHIGVRIEVL